MPFWFWGLVLGGFLWGLYEVVVWERRLRKKRLRRIRKDARRAGLEPADPRTERDIAVLLLVVPAIEPAGPLHEIFVGSLAEDLPVTFFEYDDVSDLEHPCRKVGFALEYPTDWPTFELGSLGSQTRADDFSRAILASELTDYMSHQTEWVFGFSGRFALGVTEALAYDDLVYVLETAEGVADRVPATAIDRWRSHTATGPQRHDTSAA